MRRYIIIAAAFLLATLPGAIEDWLSLYDRFFRNADEPVVISLANWYSLFFPLFALAVLMFGIWWTRPTKIAKPATHDDLNELTDAVEHSVLTQEYIAERLSFIQQLRAAEDQLVKNIHFNIPESVAHYFSTFCQESDVGTIVQQDNMVTISIRLLTERFHALTFHSLDHQARGQKLMPSTITDDDIRNECNGIRHAVTEYRNLVDEWMKFAEALAEKGMPRFWEHVPWSVNIHKKLADDYDDLMVSIKNLRNATPRAFQNLLPKDDQLTKFPRVPLWG